MKIKARRVLRYFGLALAILFFLWMAALAAVYFFVDVNKIKNAAVTYVNENTKGELSVGEVKLKLFPIVHFEVNSIIFKSSPEFQKKDLFRCTSAKLSFGIWSLIFGKPNISLKLDRPYVDFIVKDKKTNNISDLMVKKESASTATVPVEEKKPEADSQKKEKKDALYYLFISRFTFDVNDAELKYTSPKSKYDVRSLSFKLMVDPADKSVALHAGSPLDLKDKKFTVSGNWKIDTEVKPTGDDSFDVFMLLDATGLSYVSKSVEKPKGVPLKLELTASGNEATLNVKKLVLTLFKPWLTMTGKVSGLKEETTSLDLKVKTAPMDIAELKKILPALKSHSVSGSVDSRLGISGTLQKMLLDVELDATNTEIKNESFNKAKGVPLKAKLIASKTTDNIDVQLLKLWLVYDIAEANAKLTELEAKEPNVQFNLKYLDLDLAKLSKVLPVINKKKMAGTAKITASTKGPNNFIIDVFSPYLSLDGTSKIVANKTSTKVSAKTSEKSAVTQTSKPLDKKQELFSKEEMKSLNDLTTKYSLLLNMKVNKLQFKQLIFNDLIAQASASKGVLTVSKFKTNTLGGSLSSGLSLSSNVARPSYNANFDATKLKVTNAVETLMPDLRGVLDGILSGKILVSASGYTVGDVQKSLTGNGNFAFDQFVYSSQELNQVINQKLTDNLGSLSPTKGKNIFGGNPGWETVQGVFNIKNEKINIDKILAKEKEYLAEGNGNIDFNKYMDMNFNVTVPYNNLPYEPFRVEKKNLSQLPLHLTGPVAKPKVDVAKLLKYFADKTLDHEKKKIKEMANKEVEKVKAQAKKETDKIKSQATDKLKNAIKGLKF